MAITLQDLGKKYNRQWIFRHLQFDIKEGDRIAITGHNGSGKSTLLKLIGGFLAPTEGQITFENRPKEDVQLHFSIAAPYLNLVEEFTLLEHLDFHHKFKKSLLNKTEICKVSGLEGNENKPIRDFSSGMKQRLRLSLCFFFESKAILLDEPTANLDQEGIDWYQELVQRYASYRTIIIASNQPAEYAFCDRIIEIEKFKHT